MVVNENTTAYLTIRFLDAADEPAVPASLTYRIDDVFSGRQVTANTSLAAASEVTVTLTPDETRIFDEANPLEQRRVTVSATYGAGDAKNAEFLITIRNLHKIPLPG
jgi:hypothetical protein